MGNLGAGRENSCRVCFLLPPFHRGPLPRYPLIANETGEDVRMVRQPALALHRYYECIKNFVKQQRLDDYRLRGGDV